MRNRPLYAAACAAAVQRTFSLQLASYDLKTRSASEPWPLTPGPYSAALPLAAKKAAEKAVAKNHEFEKKYLTEVVRRI